MELNSSNVERIFKECLGDEGQEGTIQVEGCAHNMIFKKDKLEEHKEEIFEMLMQLPENFRESCGGGYSFLAACETKDGRQWTGMHLIMEQLFTLGIGINKVKCLLPRKFWTALPGNVPYYMICDKESEDISSTKEN